MVFNYHDFGPQVVAYETIGMEWYQWDYHGDPDPNYQYDIKVVVYRDIPLHQVQAAYPILKEKKQDYRYLSYAKAMAYLDGQISEDYLPTLTATLRQTRSQIEKELGNPTKPWKATE